MVGQVPWVESLEDVYSESAEGGGKVAPEHQQRFTNLITAFRETYGAKPDFVSRSPGRVNIIGEHVDYSLYNVLPAAVTVDVLIAVRALDTKQNSESVTIKIANTNPKYSSKEITISQGQSVAVDKSDHNWSNYFKAGLSGSLEFLKKKHKDSDSFLPKSMELLVDGNVPAGGGLSSSAAFVCASALAVMAANGHDVSKQDLLDLCIVSERSVGVYSGGMDQAASIFSERGYLLYCRFFPKFSAEHVPVPASSPEVTFLVAQSLVTSDKAVTAPKHYNLRVVEVTLATVVLAKLHDLALNPDDSSLGFCLRNFQHEVMKARGELDAPLEEQLDTVIEIIESKLTQTDGYTREEIADILGISVDGLEKNYMSKFPVQAERFMLRQRAMHVLTEARRVLAFRDTLSHSRELGTKQLEHLGDLMNETQTSCRDIYECSCPEIDEICTIARKAGALGSRLTGAGWGGCTVHLIPQEKVEGVKEALKQQYYDKHFPGMSEDKLREAIVISKPGRGSTLIVGKALEV